MVRALVVVMIGASPALAKDVVTATGTLDFELVDRGATVVLRSKAYAITFPGKPTLQPLQFDVGSDKAQALNATFAGGTGAYGITVRPIPMYWGISPAVELVTVRDGMIKAVGAKLTSDTPIRIAGVDGRHVVATTSENGKPVYIVADVLWDREHRTTIALMTFEASSERSAAGRAFIASFAIAKGARGPLDEADLAEGAAIKADAPGLEVVRRGATYVVKGGAVSITFPLRPVFRTYATAPLALVGAVRVIDDMDTFGMTVLSVPADQAYDGDKGLDGTRDGLVKQFANAKTKETKAKIGGIAGRRIEVTGMRDGVPARGEIDLVWDAKHRTLVSTIVITTQKQLSAAARAFLGSLAIAPN
jgi:hypothetical protein